MGYLVGCKSFLLSRLLGHRKWARFIYTSRCTRRDHTGMATAAFEAFEQLKLSPQPCCQAQGVGSLENALSFNQQERKSSCACKRPHCDLPRSVLFSHGLLLYKTNGYYFYSRVGNSFLVLQI